MRLLKTVVFCLQLVAVYMCSLVQQTNELMLVSLLSGLLLNNLAIFQNFALRHRRNEKTSNKIATSSLVWSVGFY